VRTLGTRLVKPFVTVAPACQSLLDTSVSSVPALVATRSVDSWSAAAATASWMAVTARPKSRVPATGVGYAAPAIAETRREVDEIGRDVPRGTAAGMLFTGTKGSNGKQQDQLHLMSRRDPRSWRPPAD
jgi:hypothetical protein